MIENKVENLKHEMVEAMKKMIPLVAISPESGGKGEEERARFIESLIREIGFDEIKRFDAVDHLGYKRPNIVAKIYGESREKTLWIAAHMDTVPEGDRTLWKTDPYKAYVKDDKIYGRGTEDNGQALIGTIFAIKAIKESGIKTKNNIGFIAVSDEEVGSRYGMEYLVEHYEFGKNDSFLIPDSGNEDGSEIEVAEKGILWFSIVTHGIQGHGSRPDLSKNAHRIGMKVALEIDEALHKEYNAVDKIFTPPYSTFEPTKKELNVSNINTIPGNDILYFDTRILPMYSIDDVINTIKNVIEKKEKEYDTKIDFNIVQKADPAKPTDIDERVVQNLIKILKDTRGINPKVIGIGGGTVAAIVRRKNYPAVVWSTLDPVEHSPNEYCKISNLVNDAKIFALMYINF
ncbi:MAG: M20 family metallo-hydrolase [Thermoplasmata archaeon]